MFKKLVINNFQSHLQSTLNFHNGVNVIIGASDSGKTAIIRSLRWLIFNKPGGDTFRNKKGNSTSVILTLKNGVTIKRVKSGTVNEYWVDKERYKAFGANVPEDITNILNLGDVNIQQQMDSPFLLSETSGQVALYFNRLANIDKIDSSIKNVQGWLRKLKQEQGIKEEDLLLKQEELTTFQYLDKLEVEIEVLEQMEIGLKGLIKKRNSIQVICRDLEVIGKEQAVIQSKVKHEALIDKVITMLGKLEVSSRYINELRTLSNTIAGLAQKIEMLKKYLIPDEQVDLLLVIHKDITVKRKLVSDMEYLINEISVLKAEIRKFEVSLNTQNNTLANNLSDVCPLCEQEIIKSKTI